MGTGLRSSEGRVACPPYDGDAYTWDTTLTIADDLTVSGSLTVSGDLTFGDAITDALTVSGLLKMGTNSSPLVLTAGTPIFTLYTTCAGESGSTNAEPFYMKSVLTGAGQVGGRAYFLVTSNVASGPWINAIKGDIEFGAAGSSSGLASAICAEMTLPNQTVPSGHYYPLEIEWIGQTSTSTAGTAGSGTGCIYIAATGTVTDFDDHAGLFWLNGVTAGSGHIYSAGGHTIKCYVTSSMTSKYIPLSSAENALTMTGATITAGTLTDGTASMSSGALSSVTNITMSGFFNLGSQGSGVAVVTGNEFAMEVHAKPTTALTAGDTGLSCGIRCRYEVGADQTNQISISAIDARLRPKKDLADGVHSGLNAGIEASESGTVFSGTSSTLRTGLHAYLELDANVSITSGWLTGITIDSSVHDDVSMASCTFVGLRIKKSTGKEIWEHGIYIDGSAATTGITIGAATTAIHLSDDSPLVLGTTTTNAATKITAEFDETTTGVGYIQFGSTSNPMVYNTNPGSTPQPIVDINVTHSAGAGDAVWCRGVYSSFTISGDGDSGSKLNPVYAAINIDEAAVSSAYSMYAYLTHDGTDTISGAAACLNADLYISGGNFTASQTLQTAIFTLRSDQARTVTCASENFNVVLIKNTSALAGVNALLKLVNSGSDNPAAIIHVEGSGDNGFIQFDSGSNCTTDTSELPGNATHKIKCRYDNTTFYLIGVADF